MTEPRRYRFHPLERRGLILGLSAWQILVIGFGIVVALALLRRAPRGVALPLVPLILVASLAAAVWPIGGRSAASWARLVLRFESRTQQRHRRWRPRRPVALRGLDLVEVTESGFGQTFAMISDSRSSGCSAVISVRSEAFGLVDASEQCARLASWGGVLAGVARPGSPVTRLQWIERVVPRPSDELQRHIPVDAAAPAAVAAAQTSYRQLLAATGADLVHEVLVVMTVDPRRIRTHLPGLGAGRQEVGRVLGRELRLLRGQLRNAELEGSAPFGRASLVAAIRRGYEPRFDATEEDLSADPEDPRSSGDPSIGHPWPMAQEESWSTVRTDGAWHAVYWISSWPGLDVGPDFLSPLLLAPGSRTVTVTMTPVPHERAVREAESARTADIADAELRRRAGFVSTARHRRAAEGARQREVELADGHSDFTFSGFVSVSGESEDELAGNCVSVENAARQCNLELRRLYGQQAEALSWTLPVGRDGR